MKSPSLLALLLVFGLATVACDGGAVELATTTSVLTATTAEPEPEPTTTTVADPTTTTTLVGEAVTGHEVTARIETDNGEIWYVVIPSGAYTDVDLVNFIGDLKEANPDLWGLEVFDDPAGPDALAVPEGQRTEEQQQTLADHHFVTLTDGDRVIFRGPFAEFGEFILGS